MTRLIALVMCITMAVLFMLPKTYRSTLVALSPKQTNPAAALGSYFGLPNLTIGNSSDDVIFSMLKSRRMSNDINEYLSSKHKPKFWWSLDTYIVTGGFAIEVKGLDSELTEKIANFAVENVDKINLELQISPNKPMIKVLDPAVRGTPVKKETFKKIMASGLFVFLISTLFIFFKEYFSHMKVSRK